MLIKKLTSYTYEATYYAAAANTKIWFIPGKTALKPIMYGIDPANNAKLTGDYANAQPIILPAIGYYKINFHTLNLTYSVTPLPTPNPANAYPQVALAGQGFYEFPNMLWQNTMPDLILMDKDPVNPYLFTKTLKLGVPLAKPIQKPLSFLPPTMDGPISGGSTAAPIPKLPFLMAAIPVALSPSRLHRYL
ncbi:hypothetical protein [Paraflavitalea speifideaquila]|uniref:hypothetical protein n=1 Tax=Paraflavitalea speifideaquila TaxID=3076558 RepID=UPI0028E9DEA7|nr:hypothetical protein [Paraflavitalea speifideiaquila]